MCATRFPGVSIQGSLTWPTTMVRLYTAERWWGKQLMKTLDHQHTTLRNCSLLRAPSWQTKSVVSKQLYLWISTGCAVLLLR